MRVQSALAPIAFALLATATDDRTADFLFRTPAGLALDLPADAAPHVIRELVQAGRPKNTIDAYTNDLAVLEHLIGAKSINAITRRDIAGYLAFQGYPLPEILSDARSQVSETAGNVQETVGSAAEDAANATSKRWLCAQKNFTCWRGAASVRGATIAAGPHPATASQCLGRDSAHTNHMTASTTTRSSTPMTRRQVLECRHECPSHLSLGGPRRRSTAGEGGRRRPRAGARRRRGRRSAWWDRSSRAPAPR